MCGINDFPVLLIILKTNMGKKKKKALKDVWADFYAADGALRAPWNKCFGLEVE